MEPCPRVLEFEAGVKPLTVCAQVQAEPGYQQLILSRIQDAKGVIHVLVTQPVTTADCQPVRGAEGRLKPPRGILRLCESWHQDGENEAEVQEPYQEPVHSA